MARSRRAIGRLQFRDQSREAKRVMNSNKVVRALNETANQVMREFKATAPVLTGQFRANVRKVHGRGYDGRPVVRVEIYDAARESRWRGSGARVIEYGSVDTPAHLTLTKALNKVGRSRGQQANLRGGLARGVGRRGGAV